MSSEKASQEENPVHTVTVREHFLKSIEFKFSKRLHDDWPIHAKKKGYACEKIPCACGRGYRQFVTLLSVIFVSVPRGTGHCRKR